MDAKQLGSLVLTVAVVGLALSGFYSTAIDTSEPVSIEEDVLITGGSGELSWDGTYESFQAAQTLGDAVEFTGADDSRLEGTATVAHDQTWSASMWAESDQLRTQRAVQLGGWLMVDLVNDSGNAEWRVTYYDEADWKTYQIQANASSPTTWSHLVVTANESSISLAENDTVLRTVPLADADNASVPQNVSNWDGRLEETRVLDDDATASQRGTLYSTPTAPVRANETARIYFDAWDDETTIDVYRTGADLTLSNASVVDGFEGQSLSTGGLLSSGDYQLDDGTITVTDGGRLDGAPVVFVGYDGTGGQVLNIAQVGETVNAGVQLLALGAVVGAAMILLRLWDDF